MTPFSFKPLKEFQWNDNHSTFHPTIQQVSSTRKKHRHDFECTTESLEKSLDPLDGFVVIRTRYIGQPQLLFFDFLEEQSPVQPYIRLSSTDIIDPQKHQNSEKKPKLTLSDIFILMFTKSAIQHMDNVQEFTIVLQNPYIS